MPEAVSVILHKQLSMVELSMGLTLPKLTIPKTICNCNYS